MIRPHILVFSLVSLSAFAAQPPSTVTALPSAPVPGVDLLSQEAQNASPPNALPQNASPPNAPPPSSSPQQLTRAQAEQMAIKNNPRVSVSQLLALAQHQVERQARSADLPVLDGAVTGQKAEDGSRMSAGSLTSSRMLTHAGAGANLSQLITDFGRTHNLVLTQKLEEKAANATALATEEEIVLAADQAFYDALTAQAVLQVAKQTVSTRQETETQVNQMTQNLLRSTLDLAFADVDLSQAQLLQLDAQNNSDATMASLDEVLGLDHEVTYQLIDDNAANNGPPPDYNSLTQTALGQRPDLQSLGFDEQSEQKFARAQWDQLLPSITAIGTAGTVPIRLDQYYTSNWWGSIGVNVNIPIFNGFLFVSQAREAAYQAKVGNERDRKLRDQIVRDVRTAWLQANTDYQRIAVTTQLLNEANMALQLAEARYRLGLSSIVELSQAQLQQTSAAIQNTNAQYQYRLSLATVNYQIGTAP